MNRRRSSGSCPACPGTSAAHGIGGDSAAGRRDDGAARLDHGGTAPQHRDVADGVVEGHATQCGSTVAQLSVRTVSGMSGRDDPYARLDPVPSFSLTSEDIVDGEPLGADQYDVGSGGRGISPQLAWEGAPAGTRSYAVTVLDPDAPAGSGFWHWAVANLPATVTSLPAGAGSPGGSLPGGALTLPNETGRKQFMGAAPPQGTGVHRYFVVVHAVDVPTLEIDPESTPAVLGSVLHVHTLGRAILVGTGEFGGAGSPGV